MIHLPQFQPSGSPRRERAVNVAELERDAKGNILPACAFCCEDNARKRVHYEGKSRPACDDCAKGHLVASRQARARVAAERGTTSKYGRKKPISSDDIETISVVIAAVTSVYGITYEKLARGYLSGRSAEARAMISYQVTQRTTATRAALALRLAWSERTLSGGAQAIEYAINTGDRDTIAMLETIRRRMT